jgi:hypothetical protein
MDKKNSMSQMVNPVNCINHVIDTIKDLPIKLVELSENDLRQIFGGYAPSESEDVAETEAYGEDTTSTIGGVTSPWLIPCSKRHKLPILWCLIKRGRQVRWPFSL